MWYFLVAVVILLVTMLFIRLRVRLILNEERSIFFAGYGRTGYEYDFETETEAIKLFGFPVKQLAKTKEQSKPKQEPQQQRTLAVYKTGYGILKNRGQELRQIVAIFPTTGKAVLRFGWEVFRRLEIEEIRLHITAGFDSPDLTGRAVGWYYTIVGAMTSLRGKLLFTPIWDRPALDASGRLSIAIPVYKLIGPFVRLIRDIPWKQIISLMKKNLNRRPIWKTT